MHASLFRQKKKRKKKKFPQGNVTPNFQMLKEERNMIQKWQTGV